MAIQQFDAFGNYTGGYGLADPLETEEERRRRLAKEAGDTLVGKTEVETYADGSQTRKITQEIPAAQPLGQGIQVAGPMDPEVFNRMINAESGGQQFNRQGGVLTSPKGALGLGQVMPSTAAQPGYGVPSIFDLAERRGIAVPSRDQAGAAQLLANPELNREFAQNYANAMNKQFGQQGGVAAYNAGPGRVQSNMAANQGQLNAQALPQETQGYLGKVLGGLRQGASAVANAIIPSAQAATPPAAGPVDPAEARRRAALAQRPPLPGSAGSQAAADQVYQGAAAPATTPAPAQAAPVTAPVSPYSLAAGMPPSQGLRVPGMAAGQTAQPSTRAIDLYQRNQDNPMELFRLRNDETQPQFIRERAGSRAYELMDAEIKRKEGEAQAQQLAAAAASGDRKASLTLAKELQKQEGSWLKFALLGFISPDMAGQEAMKLGFGNVDKPVLLEDGKASIVTYRADGTPIKGINEDGTPMTVKQLAQVAGALGKGVSTSAEVYVDTTTGARYRSGVDSQGKAALLNIQGGAPYRGDPKNLQVQSIGTALAKAEGQEAIKLNYAGPLAYTREGAAFAGKFNAENPGANIGYETQTPGAPLIDFNTGRRVTRNADGTINVTRTPGGTQGGGATTQTQTGGTQGGATTQTQTGGAPGIARPGASTAPAIGQAPRFQEPGFERETPGQFASRKKQYDERAKEEGQVVGKDIGQLRASQGKAEDNADYLITKTTELVNHPGFETSVGAQGASYLFGMLDKPLPPQLGGGDARDWVARFKEVQGQQFLQAIETLRGTGSISEAEGKAAQAAIARMAVSQTEQEFRTAVKDFQDIIKRGVDRNRAKLGQEPKYGTPPASQNQTIPGPAPGQAPAGAGTTSSGNRYRRVQ